MEWNVPPAPGPTDAPADGVVVLVVAALLADGASTVAPSNPPAAIDARTVEAMIALRALFIVITPLLVLSCLESCAKHLRRK